MSETLKARDFIVDFLRKELVGPSPGFPAIQIGSDRQEILRGQDSPRQRYSAGILFPQRSEIFRQNDTNTDEESPTNVGSPERIQFDSSESPDFSSAEAEFEVDEYPPDTDSDVTLANEFLPSAMGLSALVRVPEVLLVRVEAGVYTQEEMSWTSQNDSKRSKYAQTGWWRDPIQVLLELKAEELMGDGIKLIRKSVFNEEGKRVLELHVVSRPFESSLAQDIDRLVTFTLINRKRNDSNTVNAEDCFYQCGFSISASSEESCFLSYPEQSSIGNSPDDLSLQLLHLHRRPFAVGHGCAADWNGCGERASSVRTEVMPTYEIKPVLPTELVGLKLGMKDFAIGETAQSVRRCTELCDEYAQWIQQREDELSQSSNLTDALRDTANRHIANCKKCLQRIEEGIEILSMNEDVAKAFSLMNEAMLMQHVHYTISSQSTRKWILKGKELEIDSPFEKPSYNSDYQWRPFQLAFILMNIKPFTDPHSTERDIVDIIWFPTGGGKTEAYLGLSSFTMFLRRLRNPIHAGTTILMRYTLRLLTTQQFQRAASLICASEILRRRNRAELGDEQFSIGLWVGGEVTPNTERAAVETLRSLHSSQGSNKFILLSCPWCGAEMGPQLIGRKVVFKGYRKLSHPNRVRHICADPNCEFSSDQGLPIRIIDEQIYSDPPTLLIGTVDKFAMLAFQPKACRLFGIDTSYPPPELVIQDELHLISGPLGSMVGHYETVIDALCIREVNGKKIHPKIVASTATISHAESQVRGLYGRSAFLFPPQALRSGDSFFAEEREDEVGRLYVGVFATALPSHVTSQVRTMGALLQAPKLFGAKRPDVVDPYWTMVGYFNSLRELGHAATLIRADISEYLNAMWDRLGLRREYIRYLGDDPRRMLKGSVELTSRVQSNEIQMILKRLFESFDGSKSPGSIDTCFATNMIQVGLDVPRLSLMTIVGQPKTTAEYIQASSRVGRRVERPGIVVTNFNPSKPRDRSHYEHFRSYHQCIYRYVEPTSVTPFAAPVRDRALHALVIILCRFWSESSLRERPNHPPSTEVICRIKNCIRERIEAIDPSEWPPTELEIDEFIEAWNKTLPTRYGDFGPLDSSMPLMFPAGSQQHQDWDNWPYPTPTSMRNVDAQCSAQQLHSGYDELRTYEHLE